MLEAKDYEALKLAEMKEAEMIVDRINNDPHPSVRYKESRPITDIRHMFKTSVELYGNRVAFRHKPTKHSEYTPITYKETDQDVDSLGTALMSLGLKGKKIGVIGENSYKWAISYLATVFGLGVVVPLDKELNKRDLHNLVKRSEMSAVIYQDKFKDVFADIEDCPLEYKINMALSEDSDKELSFDKLLEKGNELLKSGNREFVDAQINNKELSIILFTSGTTGMSKGVMLSHLNIAADLMVAPTVLKIYQEDIFFSVLPIHHTYECTCGFLLPLYKGASIAFCEGLKHVAKNLGEVKPTIFLGVPALFEALYKKIWQNVKKKGKEDTLKKVIKLNEITKKVGVDLGNKFFKDIRAVFGGRMRIMICGGAAINPEVLQGIRDFGIMALQGYGMTECAPLGALNPDTAPKNGAIGRKLPGFDLKIHNPNEEGIGEICVQGENVMLGYYQMEEETAEIIKDGWLHTGDLGYMDDEGYAYITGRAKNVIITKNGKNVYPEEIEYNIKQIPFVQDTMVFGEDTENGQDTRIVAAIKIDDDEVALLYPEKTRDEVESILRDEIDKINKDEPIFKMIRRVIIKENDFEKNTSKKIKRFADSNKEK